ncbi:MAG: 30S ribosome-binding factor RbfA [Chloroflexi bacterium]|nr:30S ribosome-binding factor RbfA [Chloroflexota bacterium]
MRHPGHQLRLLRRRRRDPDVPHGAGPLSRRTEKLGDQIQSVLAELVRRRVKDPDVAEAMFSFVFVDISPDLSHARVHVSVLGDSTDKERVLAGLGRAEAFLHRELGKELHIRRVPRPHFILDESIEEADRMTQLLRDVAHNEGREF